MNILYVLSQQPGNTGSGVYIQWLTREAVNKKHKVKIVIGVNKGFNYKEMLSHIPSENIFPVVFKSRRLPFPVAGMSDSMPYQSTKFREFSEEMLQNYVNAFKKKFFKIKKDWQPDVIHGNHLWIVSSVIKTVFPDTPLIVSCHGTALRQKEFCPEIFKNIKTSLQKTDKVLALTDSQKKDLVSSMSIDKNKIIVTGAAYPDEIFYCKNNYRRKDAFIISYAGKISFAKGVPYLIEAFEKLNLSGIKAELHLAGGYNNEEGGAIVKTTKNPSIFFHGNISQKKLVEIFNMSHLFVLPSFFEGLPLVILEALACGCNVIVTEIENIKTWLKKELIDLNAIKFIPMPKTTSVDKILDSEKEKFVNDLKNAMENFIYLKKNNKMPNINEIGKFISKYSYKKLFEKIEKIYFESVKSI